MLGFRTRGCRMVGADGSTELMATAIVDSYATAFWYSDFSALICRPVGYNRLR